jgi:hypothetical protein
MNRPNPVLLAAYRRSLRLYPRRLRLNYQEQMLQTVRDADAERRSSALHFWLSLFTDLIRSSAKERLLMIRKQIFARPVFFYTLGLALILTLWGFPAAMSIQSAMRSAADQPQIQMAQDYASEISSGAITADALPGGHLDPTASLEPFTILYGADGKPVRSNGYLGETIPTPPAGVFAYLRTHPSDKFTWQPRAGVRIAAVVQRIDGAHPGFVLVGRSLSFVQQQENELRRGTFITWAALMALLIGGAMFLSRAHGATPRAATAGG